MEKENSESESKGETSTLSQRGSPAGKSTNHKTHDELLHKLMPNGHKGDCGY